MKKTILTGIIMALIISLSFTWVKAHEGREVGDYTIEIGWRVEPAYTGLMNGPEITISLHGGEDDHAETDAESEDGHNSTDADDHDDDTSNRVVGLEDTLQVELIFGPASKMLNLRAVPDEPGHYSADLIPTRPGDYTFRVFGTIEGFEIDESFSASDGQFSSVEPIEDIQFP